MDKKDIKKILKLKKMINNMESILKKTKNWEVDSQIKNKYKINSHNTNNINNAQNTILQNQIRQLNYIIQVNHLNYINSLNNINQNNLLNKPDKTNILELEKQKNELEKQKNELEQKKNELEQKNNVLVNKNIELEKQTKNCKTDKSCEIYKSEFYKSVDFNKEILDILSK